MSKTKPFSTIEPQTLSRLTDFVEHNLNYSGELDGDYTIQSDVQLVSLAELDRFVWLSLETTFAPFRIRGELRRLGDHEFDAQGHVNAADQWIYVKTSSPNPLCQATLKLAARLPTISHHATTFDAEIPAAAQLMHAPHIRLLLKTLFSHPIRNYSGSDIDSPVDCTGTIKAEIYNDFAAQFRRAMLERNCLRRDLHNWLLGSRETVDGLQAYLDSLFTQHRELTVVHLRLFHARERVNLVTAPVDEQHRELQALRACRAKFFDRMRRKPALFTAQPGYVWAILPSLGGGYALHLTLLFDTVALRKVLDDKRAETEHTGAVPEDHADQVGKYWVNVATGGLGGYLRGDSDLWLYDQNWVHGEVHADVPGRRGKLTEMLGYLAMRRGLVRLQNEPDGAYFGMPERKARAPRPLIRRVAKEG